MRLLLGFDFGTSYFKVGLFDAAGGLRGLGRTRVVATEPEQNWRELAVGEFWRLLREALDQALQAAAASPGDIAGLSYASQANTFVALDRHDTPLTPLVLWTDRRAAVAAADAEFSSRPEFQQTVGFKGLAPESAVTKWRWLQARHGATWERADRLMTLSDYVTWSLTGERAGDASTAALTGLYDLQQRTWWPAALDHFGIEATRLSKPLLPGAACGATTAAATRLLGLSPGIPFAVGALDHHAAAIGAGVDTWVDGSISIGTVLAVLCIADAVRPMANCFHGPHADGRRYFRLAFDPAGAGELEEFQRRHGPQQSLDELVARALSGERAADPTAAAVRTILERVARSQRQLVQAVEPHRQLRVLAATGGGARSVGWLGLIAETVGVTIVTPACPELACLGAAVFAAVASSLHPEVDAATRAMVGRGAEITAARGTARVRRS